jgi:diguanylate cyclase (GGDEF)-like protein
MLARRLFGLSVVTIAVALVGLALSLLGATELHANLQHDRSQRLVERAQQTTNLFTTVSQGITAMLTTGGAVAEATHASPAAFRRTIGPRIGQTLLSSVTLYDVRGARPRKLAWVGPVAPRLHPNSSLLRQAARTGELTLVAHGRASDAATVGVASSAAAGSRYAIYGEISVPRAVSFGGLKGVVFAAYIGKEGPGTLLAANTTHLPIGHTRLVVRLAAGRSGQVPVLVFGDSGRAGLEAWAPLLVAALGIGLTALLALQFELMRRRRDAALHQATVNNHQALHDSLTGLPNRAMFGGRVEELSATGAVLLLDLDRFKEVNDTLGHQSGDVLLEVLSKRLLHCVRSTDLVARLGGDEFGVLIQPCTDAATATIVADKIRRALGEPVEVDGLTIEVDTSIGIALYPHNGRNVEELMRHADIALYRSKALHVPVVYTPEHDHYSPARLQLVSDLRRAIADGQILVYYQPLAPAGHGVIRSVEALVRWQHPTLGMLPPDRFIPLAEQTGMIRPLTRFVLETALEQCRVWQDDGHRIGVAVNVCARDLLDVNFPREVASCLERSGVEPELLELEITEDTIFCDPVRAHAVITQLHERGVRFAIDDFGAGQSSLAYLKRLPIDVLKIDRSFVAGMAESNDRDAAIVQSAIHLGRNLHLTVVAEGVETDDVRRRLAALGCDLIQGFGLARPLPASELESMLGCDTADARAA